jgi:hypothetical protein
VFDTRGDYRLSCEHLAYAAYLSPTLNSFNLQFAAEASFLSLVIIFIWIGVRPAPIHMFVPFDEMLHSGTYIGIRRRSRWQTATGSCFRGLAFVSSSYLSGLAYVRLPFTCLSRLTRCCLPASRYPHLRSGCVASWPKSAWHCL